MASSAPSDTASTHAKETSPSSTPSIHPPQQQDFYAPTAAASPEEPPAKEKKSFAFWLIFVSLCCACFLSALDLTAVSTALPQIAADFDTADYSWIGSAYALTSTALIPWTGGLAAIFGRRAVMLVALVLFALGSALTGAGQSMAMVIGGRSIQGVGGGAILTMTEIVVTDLVPLAERGAYFGILGAVWALASAIGPPIGGALASAGAWRWLFYLNLPLSGLAMALVLLFLDVKAPKTTTKEKLEQMDWVNVIFVAASTSLILGLTWGGVTYPWSSFRVLVPLLLGIAGIVVFLLLERSFVKYPTVPFEILSHRTSLLGYLTTFLHSVVVMAIIYFLPVYFQADKGASAIQSGVDFFAMSFVIAPFAIFVGISVTVTGHYRTQNAIGWAFIVLGMGLFTLLKWDSSKAMWAGFSVIAAIGLGILYAATNFPVLAPLKPAQQPHAMAFFGFVSAFGQVFGIAIGSTILQNQLAKTLPADFAAQFGEGEIAYAAIPYIKSLDEPLRTLVRAAFADSLKVIWQTCIGLAGLGLLLSLGIQQMTLTTETDEENWGLNEREKGGKLGREEEKAGTP
ncbi:hypothetical protein JCM11641_005320 [Rhodosporidiobolus odoratus]